MRWLGVGLLCALGACTERSVPAEAATRVAAEVAEGEAPSGVVVSGARGEAASFDAGGDVRGAGGASSGGAAGGARGDSASSSASGDVGGANGASSGAGPGGTRGDSASSGASGGVGGTSGTTAGGSRDVGGASAASSGTVTRGDVASRDGGAVRRVGLALPAAGTADVQQPPPAPSDDASATATGAELYARCVACHALEYDRTGPHHCGLFGRRAGSVPGFAYSPAMRDAGITWNEASLDRFLAAPMKAVPGTYMAWDGIPDPKERALLIAWLREATKCP